MSKINQENGKQVKEDIVNVVDGKFKVSGYGYRHQQCLIMLICLTTAYSMRACIGVAVVAMVEVYDEPKIYNQTFSEKINKNNGLKLNISKDIINKEETFIFNGTSELTTVVYPETSKTIDMLNETVSPQNISSNFNSKDSINPTDATTSRTEISNGILSALLLTSPYPKFRWSQETKNVVISSFFWGYMLLQIPSGHLVHRFGPRNLLVSALAINCFISFCFPWAVYYGGWIFGVICRMLQGLSQACIIPGMYGFYGQWAPLEERSRMVGFAQGGQALGTVLGLPITGFIAASPLGWPGIFRFYGILSGLVAALVFFMVTDTPALHPKISLAERRYIEEGLGLKEGQKKKKIPVPWRSILGSRAIYFISLAHISLTWGQITLFTQIPSFMSSVMKVNIKSNGMLTALPFLVMWFTNFFFNWFTDWVIVNRYLSLTNARKMANTIGCVPAAIGLVVLAYAPKTIAVVEAILIFICAFKISVHVGSMVTHVDIAPNFAGTLMSISNFISNLVGSQAPIVASYLVTDETSEKQWRNVFFVAAGLYFFTNLAYCIFGTAEKALWNNPAGDDEDAEDVPEMKPMINGDEKKDVNKTGIIELRRRLSSLN